MKSLLSLCWSAPAIRNIAFMTAAFCASAAFPDHALATGNNEVHGRRAALVIGNSSYKNLPTLPNAVNDAGRVGQVLRDANFEVTIGEDLTKAGLEKSVRDFLQTLNDGDVALFYYSGHAVQVAGENFILPVDATLSSSYDLEVESYKITNLLDYMRAASGMQILVLDACRDNPFRNEQYYLGDKKVDVKGTKGLASLSPRQGALIVYSTAPNEVAYDGAGDISPFAGSFAENVLSPNREVREVLTTVRTQVIEKTGGRQVPWDVSSLTSQFYFVSQQNMLVLGESVTEVRVAPETRRVDLSIEPPIATEGMQLTATFDKVPSKGMLLLDDKPLKAGSEVDAKRLGDVVYATDPGQKSVELIPYTVRSGGQSASGAVAIVFDPSVAPQDEQPLVIASNEDQISAIKAVPVKLSLKPDVGTGFAPVPKVEIGGGRPTGWLRLEARDPSTQVALGEKLLVLGDLVKAEDLSSVKVRPALHQTTKQAEIVLQPAVATADAKAVVIAVDAEVNACDELAAEPLDIQAVTDGVLPNDIKVAEALQACSEAVTDFPDVPRFKFQYGRALWADGKFDLSVRMVREAIDGGHVRAGQFLGRLYQLGSGVELDPKKAIPLFEAAAKKGDPYGQYSLARALMDGKGVKKDLKRGIDLLNKSMESGHTYAMNQLGSEYLYGERVEKDVDRARVIFEKSMGRGDVWGEVNLATMYRDGIGVPKDTEKAYQLLSDANEKLHPFAARLMALMDRDAGKSDPAALLAKYRLSAARGDGWGAYFAAEVITEDPSLANSPDEAMRLYAFAVARNAGDSGKDARTRLQNIPAKQVAEAAQQLLIELGATDVAVDGKIGPGARKAASEILGTKAPSNAIDLYAELVRYQWVSSRPRLDML